MDREFLFGVDENVLDSVAIVVLLCEYTKIIELHTSNGLILWQRIVSMYVCFKYSC